MADVKIEQVQTGGGHRKLEGLATVFTILTVLGILFGSVIEIFTYTFIAQIHSTYQGDSTIHPLELAGRDIYIREGCYTCHSQMIRKLEFDVVRWGQPSTIEESMYDHPFQWGSKRTGPELARVGGKYPDRWHYDHMRNPRSMNEHSLMPAYPWLFTDKIDFYSLRKKVSVMHKLGVPYDENTRAEADLVAGRQAGRNCQ